MQMGMMEQVLPPRVEDGQKTDASAQMLGVGSNAEQGLGGRLEQEMVKGTRVLQGQRGQSFG
jgi:predicted regulator of Ras-like GTPase activity (Roadblock/LC7/MglB family)